MTATYTTTKMPPVATATEAVSAVADGPDEEPADGT